MKGIFTVLTIFGLAIAGTAQPTITSFTPTIGNVGTTVTITGTNFNATAVNNIVYFGAVRATVTAASTTSLTVTAPAGATYQPISVLDNITGLTGYSSKPFSTTFSNPFGTGIPVNYYKSKVDFTTSSNPYSVALGDIDGDGKPDMVVANQGSNTVSVFHNTSAAGTISATSFAEKVDFITGSAPYSVAISDMDGDGKPDIVVANISSHTLSILRNTSASGNISSSSFAAKVDFTTSITPVSVAISDLDGDGKPDMVAANYSSNTVSVFHNTAVSGNISATSFAAKVDFATGGNPISVAVGVVDPDGKPEIVVTNEGSNTVSVFHNTSTTGSISAASFAAKVDLITGTAPYSVAIGDMDGDGKSDILVANYNSNTVSVFPNNSASGSIDASSFAAKIDFTTGVNPASVAIGDVDGDSKPDVLLANYSSNTVSVLRNISTTGNISTTSFAAKVDFATGTSPFSVAIGDIDGDEIPEIAVANNGHYVVSVLQVSAPTQTIVTSFNPTSGSVGTTVTINGRNFNATAANNIVYFGAVRATVTAASKTSITVTAPAGATYQPISVLNTTTGLTGYSSRPFITTFTNPFGTGIPVNFYKPKVDFTTGSNPRSVAIADMDGDNKPDLVMVNLNSNTVSIFRNTSASGSISATSFAAKVDFTTGSAPFSVAIGDVNGDGKPDLVIANFYSNTVSVLRNTSASGSISAASFAAKVDFATGYHPTSVAIGDVDGDGKLDIAVANSQYSSNTVSVLRNTSATGSSEASFAANVDFAASGGTASVAIEDVDGDGKPDIVVANISFAIVSVFRNTSETGNISASSFAAKVDFTTGSNPYSVAIGDMDGDSKSDIVVANLNSNTVSVLRNTSAPGTVSSASFAAKVDFITGNSPYSVAIGDVDGDGKPDVIIANNFSNNVSVFRNTSAPGSMSATSFADKVDFATGANPVSVTIGDLDGDGIPEIAVTNNSANSLAVLQIGTPPPPTVTSFAPMSGNVGTTVTITGTNFNATPANNVVYFGAVQATVTAANTTSITVTAPAGATYQPISVLNNTTGLTGYSAEPFITTFTNPFGTGIPANYYKPKVDFTTGGYPYSVAIGDMDGDGKPDMVVANSSTNTVSVFRNISASGTIGVSSFAAKVDFTTGASPRSVAICDVDGDGKLDIVVTNRSSNTVSVFHNTSFPGSITATSFAAKVDFTTGFTPVLVTIGDMDGDGKPEIVVTNYYSNAVSVLRNTSETGSISATSFAPKVDLATGTNPISVGIGDVDADGKGDIVVANYSSRTVSVFRNTSASGGISATSFAGKVDFTTGDYPYSVAIGDVDRDGKADIMVTNSSSNTVSVLHNASTSGIISGSSFAAKVDFTTGYSPASVVIADVDGDGKPDMAVTNITSNTISILRNTSANGSISPSSFAAQVEFTTGALPYSVAIGDLDGDGKPEIAVTNGADGSFSVLQVRASSQITDHYRTRQSGNWNDVNTWESSPVADFSSALVSPATLTPDYNANAITIQNTHTVRVTANVTTDQTTVKAGGALIVGPNVVLTFK